MLSSKRSRLKNAISQTASIGIIVVVIIIVVGGVYAAFVLSPNTSVTTSSTTTSTTANTSTTSTIPTSSSTTTVTSLSSSTTSTTSSVNAISQVIIAQNSEPGSLDPMLGGGTTAYNIEQYIYQELVRIDYVGSSIEYVPLLAVNYTQVNSTAWTFNLRHNVMFQDGTPFNASAVVAHYDRLLNASNTRFSGSRASIPQGFTVTIINNYEVMLSTPKPWPLLLETVADPILGQIASPSSYVQYGSDVGTHPVGTGPYVLQTWQQGVKIVLQTWSGYWGSKPTVSTLQFQSISDDNSRALALESGSVDFITNVPPQLISGLQNAGYSVINEPGQYTVMLFIDTSQAPLSNRLVRLAMNYAINDTAIASSILMGGGEAANNAIAPSVFGYTAPAAGTYFNYNVSKAKALLAEAGYPNGFTFTLYVTGNYLLDVQVAQALSGYFANVGITANVQQINIGTYLKQLRAGVQNVTAGVPDTAGILGLSGIDADTTYYNIWYSNSTQNYWHFSNSTYDNLVLQAHTSTDPQTRLNLYAQAYQLLLNNPPAIFLYWENNIAAYKSTLHNVQVTPAALDIFNNATSS